MLKPIYFAGVLGPCEAEYGIHIEQDTLHIVVIQSKPGTSLWNGDKGRNHVLNAILDRDLAGIRIDQIRYHLILDTATNGMLGIELPVHLDHDDYRSRGNRVLPRGWLRRTFGVWNHDAVAGSGRCYVDFDEREGMPTETIERFCAVLGYYSANRIGRAVAPA